MKTIVLLALFGLVSAASGRSAAEDPAIQNMFICRGRNDGKCSQNIASDSDMLKAIQEACPNCSSDQKYNMMLWIDAYKKGASVEEANKKYNPNDKYFDTTILNQ